MALAPATRVAGRVNAAVCRRAVTARGHRDRTVHPARTVGVVSAAAVDCALCMNSTVAMRRDGRLGVSVRMGVRRMAVAVAAAIGERNTARPADQANGED